MGEYGISNGYSKWALGAGWAAYITQHDLHADPNILNGYKCAVLIGHDEYWSWDMRKGLDDWIEAGGHLARFAGNMNWQIRYENDGLVQVAYKGNAPKFDPFAKDPAKKHLVTTPFDDIRYGN